MLQRPALAPTVKLSHRRVIKMATPLRTLGRTALIPAAAGYRYRHTLGVTSKCLTLGNFTEERRLAVSWKAPSMSSSSPSRLYSQGGPGAAPTDETSELLGETKGSAGILILNRPKHMNALNTNLMRLFGATLTAWVKEGQKKVFVVKSGGGKVFCAGGDIRMIAESAMRKTDKARELMRVGYAKGALIHQCPIPYCALIDGTVMGGAVGISANGRYRVGTERTVFVLPEMNLGFYPDCTATHFLPRMKGKLGHFLGLTGYKLAGADVYHAGVATHAVESANLKSLEDDLCRVDDQQDVKNVLDRYTRGVHFIEKPFSLAPYLEEIDEYFSAPTVEEIIQRMQSSGTAFAAATLKLMSAASPLSLKVAKRAFDESITKTLAECLETEYRISARMAYHNNFIEGVRASLITKTGRAAWKPARLEECTPEMVDSFFEPLEDTLLHDTYL